MGRLVVDDSENLSGVWQRQVDLRRAKAPQGIASQVSVQLPGGYCGCRWIALLSAGYVRMQSGAVQAAQDQRNVYRYNEDPEA